MNVRAIASVGVTVVAGVALIAAITGAFTETERQTIARMKARITALEAQAATAEANDVALAADMDVLDGNIATVNTGLLAVDAGLRDLVADEGPLWQIDRHLADLQTYVWDRVPVIALTDITPLVACGPETCTVDVEWYSDPPATGQVEWGPTTTYGTLTTLEPDLLGYHKQRLGVLPADGSTYHFRVIATIPDEEAVTSAEAAFVAQ